MISLDAPLVFFDLEATGTDPESARIIQIAYEEYVPGTPKSAPGDDRERNAKLYSRMVALVDPGEPIPEKVTEITGISHEDVKGKPHFEELVQGIVRTFDGAHVAGYNIQDYDVPLLRKELGRCGESLRLGEVLDAYRLEKTLGQTLGATYRRYTVGGEFNEHDALGDVKATKKLMALQMRAHMNGEEEHITPQEWVQRQRGDYIDVGQRLKDTDDGIVMDFGKHRGRLLEEVADEDPNYLEWCAQEMDEAAFLDPIEAALNPAQPRK